MNSEAVDSSHYSHVVDDLQNSSDIPADGHLSWKTGYSPTPLQAMTSSTDGFENVSFTVDLYDPPFTAMSSAGDWCRESSQSNNQSSIITQQQQQQQQQHQQQQQQQQPLETKQPMSLLDQLQQQVDTKATGQSDKSLDEDLTAVFVPHMVFSCIIMLTVAGSIFGCFGFAFAVLAARNEEQGRPDKSRMWSRASFACSAVGFLTFLAVVSAILVLVLVGLIYTDPE